MPEVVLRLRGEAVPCEVTRDADGWLVVVRGRAVRLRVAPLGPGLASVEIGERRELVRWARAGPRTYLHLCGSTVDYELGAGTRGAGEAAGIGDELVAPMPGAVTHVYVSPGETVRAGQPLLVVEAMKMEHVIRAPRAGVVRAVRVRAAERVEGGAVVAELGPTGPEGAPNP